MAARDAPGASVAKVATSHGINANVVQRWRQLARERDGLQQLSPRTRQRHREHATYCSALEGVKVTL
jgi:transposase-like protein